MYACQKSVSPLVISIIVSSGVEVLDGDKTYGPEEGVFKDIGQLMNYASLKMSGVMGMFDPLTPDKLYIFDHVSEGMIDYVMLHELGHLMSFRAKLGFHALAERMGLHNKNPLRFMDMKQLAELRNLQYEEECIADCFAMGMLMRLGLNYEIPLLNERMNGYVQRLGEGRVQELNKMAYGLAMNMNRKVEREAA